jgi:simple sugar transport system ATP-binding protein
MHKKTQNNTGGAKSAPPAIAIKNIYKSFGAVQANRDIHLDVAAGTIHGIVGENGAGNPRWSLSCMDFIQLTAARYRFSARLQNYDLPPMRLPQE